MTHDNSFCRLERGMWRFDLAKSPNRNCYVSLPYALPKDGRPLTKKKIKRFLHTVFANNEGLLVLILSAITLAMAGQLKSVAILPAPLSNPHP